MELVDPNIVNQTISEKILTTSPLDPVTKTPWNSTLNVIVDEMNKGHIKNAKYVNPYIEELTKSNDIQEWNKGYYLWALTHKNDMKNKLERLPNSFLIGYDEKNKKFRHISDWDHNYDGTKFYWAPKRGRGVAQYYHFPQYRYYKDFYSNSPIAQTFSELNEKIDNNGGKIKFASDAATIIGSAATVASFIPGPHQPIATAISYAAMPIAAIGGTIATKAAVSDAQYRRELKHLQAKQSAFEIKAENAQYQAETAYDQDHFNFYMDESMYAAGRAKEAEEQITNLKMRTFLTGTSKLTGLIADKIVSSNKPQLPPVTTRIPTSTIKSAPISGGGGGSSFKNFYGSRRARSFRRNQRRLKTYYPYKRRSSRNRRRYSKRFSFLRFF